MNKFTKGITALLQIVRKPWLLNLVLDEDSLRQKRIEKSTATVTASKPLLFSHC